MLELSVTVLGGLLILFGGYIIVMNWMGLFYNLHYRKHGIDKHHSPSPVIGPLVVMGGAALLPWGYQHWHWLAWLPDFGTWVLIFSPILILLGKHKD